MSTLDLHGTKHAEVKDKLTRYFFWDKPGHKHYTLLLQVILIKMQGSSVQNGLINTNTSIIFHPII